MRLKTYRAHDLATALERARRELGPEAVVLATREERGALGVSGVEVTVGVEPSFARTSDNGARPEDG